MKFQIYKENFLYTKIEYNYFNGELRDEQIEANCKITPIEQSLKRHIKNSHIVFSGIWDIKLFSSVFSSSLEVECTLKIEINPDEINKHLEDIQDVCISKSLDFIDKELRKLLEMTPSKIMNKIIKNAEFTNV